MIGGKKLKQVAKAESLPKGIVFESDLGWMAILVRDGKIARLQFGHPSAAAAKRALVSADSAQRLPLAWEQPDRLARGWIRELQNYAAGKPARLADFASQLAIRHHFASFYPPTPLIVPCHRVLGTSGLGGYSAPQGLSMKLHLLNLEGAIEHFDCDCEHC